MESNDLSFFKFSASQSVRSGRSKYKVFWHFFMATVIALCFNQFLCGQSHLTQGHVQSVDNYFKKLEAFGLSGSLLIGTPEQVLLKKDYGLNNQSESFDCAYLVGSLTKQFTATAVLLLEQRGLLNTDQPISDYLSDIPADKSPITLHQLLTHTSGLKDDYWDQHRDLTEEAYIAMMLGEELVSSPGSRFRYANFGYHLLAKIIETVSGREYERFLNEELFRPIGISDTGFNLVDWKGNQVAQYTDWTTEDSEHILKNPLDRPIYLQPEGSGGLLSTTGDLYNWYQAIFHSTKILTPQSRMKLLTTEKENYAYGWEVYQTSRGTTLIEHGGYDSWVGVVTGLYNFADEDMVVIFLGNTHMSQILRKDHLMDAVETLTFGGQIQIPPGTILQQYQTEIAKHYGIYKKGSQFISISKGRTNNQIRLRTTDPDAIRQLLLPDLRPSEKRTDVQLEYVFNHIAANNYEALRRQFFENFPFDALKERYSATWSQLTGAMGPYKGFEVLHTVPNIFEGKFELQLFLVLEFERGTYHLRAFRNHHGQIHLQPFNFPEQLEIYLSPSTNGEFAYWDLRTGTTSKINFQQESLSINGVEEVSYKKD